jgi:uncharacterized protein with WD repeat
VLCCGAYFCCHTVAKKIPLKGVATFQPCPADKPLLAAFIAEAKGQPAVATVIDHSGEQPVTISRKSFYRATGNTHDTTPHCQARHIMHAVFLQGNR